MRFNTGSFHRQAHTALTSITERIGSTSLATGGALVELETITGQVRGEWPLSGVPDATFVNPTSGIVHVVIGKPGLVQSVNPRIGACTQFTTATAAKTTALVPPSLYVFSPAHHGVLVLVEGLANLPNRFHALTMML